MRNRNRSWVTRSAVALLLLIVSLHASPAAAATITYVYDALGRLVAVIDDPGASNDSVIYHYDAVGNLLGIDRQSAGTVAIIDFTPREGPTGTVVTIYGTGFSATPASNTVQFNGTGATITAATTSQLTVTVPGAATTGPISVTSPSGNATSSTNFTKTSTSAVPTITSFTPTVGLPGTSVSITGTNFETIPSRNRPSFYLAPAIATSATSTTIGTAVPGGATSGRITVATPGGLAVSSSDFFVPPSGFTAADITFTGRLVIGGSTLTATLTPAGTNGLIVFDGTAGQQVSLGIGQGIVQTSVTIYQPNGATVAGVGTDFLGGDLHIAALPVTGTYTILVDPAGGYSGNLPLTLSQDLQLGTITANSSAVAVSLTRPGQRARGTFSGTAGQRLSLLVDSVTVSANVSVLAPNGSQVTALFLGQTETLELGPLATTGTYTVLVDPDRAKTGSMTLRLSTEITGSITIGGASVPITIAYPGQRARLTFSGTAGQRLSLGGTSASIPLLYASVLNPDGSTLSSAQRGGNPWDVDVPVLGSTGTHTLLVDPQSSYTGAVTLTLSEEVSGTITPGGSAVAVSLSRAGQRARLTFSGTAGQRMSLKGTGITIWGHTESLVTPAGTSGGDFFNTWGTSGGNAFGGPITLSTTGTHAILADSWNAETGNMTLTLYDVPADVTGSLTINGATVPVALTGPGQKAVFTFSATAGQAFTVRGNNSTMGCVTILLQNPGGGTSSSPCGNWTLGQTPSSSVTYTVTIDPQGANTGSVDLSVTAP